MMKRIHEAVAVTLYNARLHVARGDTPATQSGCDAVMTLFNAECAVRLESSQDY